MRFHGVVSWMMATVSQSAMNDFQYSLLMGVVPANNEV
jgi:hypothetical protein